MIPNRPPPRLRQSNRWSATFVNFVSTCLVKDPEHRPSAHELLEVEPREDSHRSTRSFDDSSPGIGEKEGKPEVGKWSRFREHLGDVQST